jgi:hypothetical protein
MKKISISFLAISLAVMLFAFTKTFAEGPGCNELLYWFKVRAEINKTCNQISLQSELLPIIDIDGDCVLTSVDFVPVMASNHPYGCQDTQVLACALGFNTTQIELFVEDGICKFRPIQSKIPLYRCCVKRPNNK